MPSQFDKTFISIPEVQAQKGLWQNDFHEYDVFNHTLQCVKHIKKLTKDRDLIAAAYLHDIGKPETAKPKMKGGVWLQRSASQKYHQFANHEKVGEKIVLKMMPGLFEHFGLNQKKVARLVGAHYLPMLGIKSMRKAIDYRDFLKKFSNLEKTLDKSGLSRDEVLLMFLADKIGQGRKVSDRNELFLVRQALLKKGRKLLRKIFLLMKKNYHWIVS